MPEDKRDEQKLIDAIRKLAHKKHVRIEERLAAAQNEVTANMSMRSTGDLYGPVRRIWDWLVDYQPSKIKNTQIPFRR